MVHAVPLQSNRWQCFLETVHHPHNTATQWTERWSISNKNLLLIYRCFATWKTVTDWTAQPHPHCIPVCLGALIRKPVRGLCPLSLCKYSGVLSFRYCSMEACAHYLMLLWQIVVQLVSPYRCALEDTQ